MSTVADGTGLDLHLGSGKIGALRWGSSDAPLAICIPPLLSDERAFEFLGSRLGSHTRQVVAISPRGRGRSDVTAAGSYGWPAHARDVLEVASSLGQERFDLVGWSFGAAVAMQAANDAPGLIRRLVLIDTLGRPEPSALAPIAAGLQRPEATFATADEYVEQSLATYGGAMRDCEQSWRRYLLNNLTPTTGGFTPARNKAALMEDALYTANQDPYVLWPALTMPVLAVRGIRPMIPGIGLMVTQQDCDRLSETIPQSRIVEVDANHMCVGMVEATAAAIAAFLAAA